MGRRIREYDWASSSLGPISSWPSSLCNSINILLGSRFPMFIWWGPDMIQFYNDAYRPSLGNNGKHPKALGQRGEECWPEIWPVIHPLIRQVLDSGDSIWREDQLLPIYRNGQLEDVYWTYSYSPIMDEDGIHGVLVVCSENTEKVKAFKQLKDSEDLLSFATEAAELGTWEYNPANGRFVGNKRLKEWFGLTYGEEIDLILALDSIHIKDRQRVRNAIEYALQYESGGLYDIRYSLISRLDGKERIVHAKGRAWFNEDKIAYRFNGTLQDVTDQESANIRLQKAQHNARLAIESAHLGVYEVDLTTSMVTSSERFNSIVGLNPHFTRQELIDLVHPEFKEIQANASLDSFATGTLDYECRIIRPDGQDRWVRIKGLLSYGDDGKPAAITGILQDITIEKQAEEKLTGLVAERTNELQRSNEDLMQFAHVISHDLKEPVRKIRLYANKIAEDTKRTSNPPDTKLIDKILHSTSRMSSMIEGVLNYSSLNASHDPFEKIDLNTIVHNVLTDLEVVIQEKQAAIELTTLPVVDGIQVLVRQLFYNLINNSLKFTRPDVPPVIRVFANPAAPGQRSYAEIAIADNGIGFDKQYSAKIFESFTRLNSKDRFEGTGLGLSLCKKIIQRHRGQIHASGEAGKGATISFTLPLHRG